MLWVWNEGFYWKGQVTTLTNDNEVVFFWVCLGMILLSWYKGKDSVPNTTRSFFHPIVWMQMQYLEQ